MSHLTKAVLLVAALGLAACSDSGTSDTTTTQSTTAGEQQPMMGETGTQSAPSEPANGTMTTGQTGTSSGMMEPSNDPANANSGTTTAQ